MEPIAILDGDLQIVSIPKILHAHFECVVGKHVFIDKPWTQIPYKKITDHLQKEKTNSCFWDFRKELEVMKSVYFYFYNILYNYFIFIHKFYSFEYLIILCLWLINTMAYNINIDNCLYNHINYYVDKINKC